MPMQQKVPWDWVYVLSRYRCQDLFLRYPANQGGTEDNGKQHRVDLPVEVWQRGPVWTFKVTSTTKITDVILDPDKKLPDVNRKNNTLSPKGF